MVFADTTTPNTLITKYLEMRSPSEVRSSISDDPSVELVQMETPDLSFYKYMYKAVGDEWAWRDRLYLSNSELWSILASPNNEVHVLYADSQPAGYVELAKQDDGSVEIAYFGLRRGFMGRGLGKHLLSCGIQKAWDMGANRVWLHTCNLDGPHALRNYEKRGFKVYMTQEEEMPEIYT